MLVLAPNVLRNVIRGACIVNIDLIKVFAEAVGREKLLCTDFSRLMRHYRQYVSV